MDEHENDHEQDLSSPRGKIIKVLLSHDFFLNTTEISELAHVSWNTADEHLTELLKRELVIKRKRGNRVYWKAI